MMIESLVSLVALYVAFNLVYMGLMGVFMGSNEPSP